MSSGPPTVFGNQVVRAYDLPDAVVPLTDGEFVSVAQVDLATGRRRLRKTTTGQLLANHLAAANPHPQYASGAAVAQAIEAADVAVLAAADAVAAAATTNGVVGLGTSTGTSSAYVVTAILGPGAGKVGRMRFHVTNAAHPITLSWNATVRSLRQGDGSPFIASMIDPAVEYLVFDTGTQFWVFGLVASVKSFLIFEAIRAGTFNFYHKQPGDAEPRVVWQTTSDGRFVVRTGGDGVTFPATEVFIVNAAGDVRAARGRFLDANALPLYGSSNPPPPVSTQRELLMQVPGAWWEATAAAPVAIGARPWFVSGMDVVRGVLRVPVGSTHCIFEQQPDTTSLTIRAQAAIVFDSGWSVIERPVSVTQAQLGSASADNALSRWVFAAGDPTAEGWTVGSKWRGSGFSVSANNDVEFTVVSFGGVSNREVTVTPAPTTMGPDGAWTFTRQSPNELVAWVWEGTNDGATKTQAQFGSVVSDAVAGTFTFSAGDPVAEGLAVGQVWRFSGLARLGNNDVDFTIMSLSGGSNRVMTVWPVPETDAVADATFSMVRRGRRRLSIPAGWWRVHKGFNGETQPTMLCESVAAYAVASTVALPAFTTRRAALGQSWPNRGMRNWVWGMQKRRAALGLDRDVFVHQGTAFGASDLLRGTTSDPRNYYIDQTAGFARGPNYDAMIEAILRAPGGASNLDDVVVMYGLNGMLTFAATGDNTPAIRIQAQLALQGYMRTDLGRPALRFWIVPLTSQALGTFAENKWWAMRKSQLDTVAQDPDGLTFRAPGIYDAPRPWGDEVFRGTDDRHYSYFWQALHGARIEAAIANVAHGQSNFVGPKMVGGTRTGARTYLAQINWYASVGRNRPVAPVGFAVVSDTDPFATPLEISGFALSGDNYVITTATDDVNAVPVFPYGSFWEAEARDRLIGALDPISSEWWPLQERHPTV